MNISQKMLNLFIRQIIHEDANKNLYLKISSVLKNMGLNKIGIFFAEQADGEYGHKKILIDYLNNRNVNFEMGSIPEVNYEFKGVIDLGTIYVEREKGTTSMLKDITHLALMDGDDLTYQHIMETLIKEQIEEESTSQTVLDIANLAQDDIFKFSVMFEQNLL